VHMCERHLNEYYGSWTGKAPEEVFLRACSKCKVPTPVDGFYRSPRKSGWQAPDATNRQSHCKKCQAKYQTTTRAKHPEKYRAIQKALGKRRQTELGAIKTLAGCKDCGYRAHPAALDFHHLDKKTFSLSRAASKGASLARLLQEISRCVVLCANCHRIRHAIE
jgi:hypothetical protein